MIIISNHNKLNKYYYMMCVKVLMEIKICLILVNIQKIQSFMTK